jgi:hypothetical protein
MATLATFTGVNIGVLTELGNALSAAAATAGPENRVAGTFTLADTGGASPYVISSTDVAGNARTWRVG